ncbi:hypothetical protein [Hymenobacter terrenus]|uniref:hypothetical protein n=1 Tax=Hymenobacter terrenus TaxID=1629124 RepID=UPI000A6522B7|nr:hypothetical protein [Hymenobacter terrenus]
MFEFLAIALFQFASFTGSFATTQSSQNSASTAVVKDGGTGGWGHDVVSNNTTPPVTDGGTGGWGHDK